jgi:hypothetical protein
MKMIPVLLAAALGASCVATTPIPAGAPRVLASLPGECLALYQARGEANLWFGGFHGAKEGRSPFGVSDDDVLYDTFQRACFPDERSCRRWLYDLQTEYKAMVYSAECRRGLPA